MVYRLIFLIGLSVDLPCIDSTYIVDIRTISLDVPPQEVYINPPIVEKASYILIGYPFLKKDSVAHMNQNQMYYC